MRLYKYRDLSKADREEFHRLQVMLRDRAFWCARPDTLNDPEEFSWRCDYTATDFTVDLLATLISEAQSNPIELSRKRAFDAISSGRLSEIASPIVRNIIGQCRNEIGVVCFGTSPRNPLLWKRYGGDGAGVCVDLEVPDDLLGSQLHEVQYLDSKVVHIDQLMRGAVDPRDSMEVFALSLLSKPSCWAPEAEIRFISKMQQVLVSIDRSRVVGVWLGSTLKAETRSQVEQILATLPYRISVHVA